MPNNKLTISVLICTYRRPSDLLRCLNALERLIEPPSEILVVVREQDTETREALRARSLGTLPVRLVDVVSPGLIAARRAGLDACHSDIISMIDDDTAPHSDWLERIREDFLIDDRIAGVGGRDRCFEGDHWNEARKDHVGQIQWFGRLLGYHHLGFGAPRKVQILKGANMSYRMSAVAGLRVDERLRGSGAQPHEDSMFSIALRKKGFDLLYDPRVLVDHYESPRDEPRHYSVMVSVKDAKSFREVAFNWVLVLWTEFSLPRHLPFVLWNFFVGTRIAPGLAQAIRFTPTMRLASWHRFWLTQQGTFEAYQLLARDWFEQRRKRSRSRSGAIASR